MKKLFVLGLVLSVLALAACSGKRKPVAPTARAEAAQNAGEADFAISIRDFPRAEKLLEKCVELNPNEGRYWKTLGILRKKRGDSSGARKAYEQASKMFEADYRESKKQDLPGLIAEVETQVILGHADEARKILEQSVKDHPDEPRLKEMVDQKIVDKMLADPEVKEVSL